MLQLQNHKPILQISIYLDAMDSCLRTQFGEHRTFVFSQKKSFCTRVLVLTSMQRHSLFHSERKS